VGNGGSPTGRKNKGDPEPSDCGAGIGQGHLRAALGSNRPSGQNHRTYDSRHRDETIGFAFGVGLLAGALVARRCTTRKHFGSTAARPASRN